MKCGRHSLSHRSVTALATTPASPAPSLPPRVLDRRRRDIRPGHGFARSITAICRQQPRTVRLNLWQVAMPPFSLPLPQLAHRAIGRVVGSWEAHNRLFAGVCWGLQRRFGVSSADPDYDIRDEPGGLESANRLARRLASADSLTVAVEIIHDAITDRKSENRLAGLGIGMQKLLILAGGAALVDVCYKLAHGVWLHSII